MRFPVCVFHDRDQCVHGKLPFHISQESPARPQDQPQVMIVVQISDVLQYVFGKLFGKRPIVPKLSPNKTVEGFIGGILSASCVGMALWWATPFSPWAAFLLSLLICLAGFAGGLCMSAIKRDSGIKDFGAMIEGHGGMMDRLDSLCFAAPVFFHVLKYFYT